MRLITIAILITIVNIANADIKLREENISDREVLEVEAIVKHFNYGPINSIAGVTDQCECTEGNLCESQLTVFTEIGFLSLSRFNKKWDLGVYQKWKFNHDRLIHKWLTERDPEKSASKLKLVRAHESSNPMSCVWDAKLRSVLNIKPCH